MSTHPDIETLRFLFEQRLELFNVRRDHEWRIFFGVITLIAAVDAALLTTEGLSLPVAATTAWQATLIVLLVGSTAYQWGVQARNRVDRLAMDDLYARMCDVAAIPAGSVARVPIDEASIAHLEPRRKPLLHHTYLWAFIWQTLILIVVCLISWFIPSFVAR